MRVTALAGGVGGGKFLRGLVRVVPAGDVTVVVNTADDIELHGLHVSPDLDSVMYWLAGLSDRERGWGRANETFRTTEELRRLGAEGAWFGLGDLDVATHLLRTSWLRAGRRLSEATAELARRHGVEASLLPMTDDPVTTMVRVLTPDGADEEVHFQEYWVKRRAHDEVKAVRYAGAEEARPAPGVLEAIRTADAVVLPPSNPIASIGPVLAVPGIRAAVEGRRDRVAGVSGIVGGAPLAGGGGRPPPPGGGGRLPSWRWRRRSPRRAGGPWARPTASPPPSSAACDPTGRRARPVTSSRRPPRTCSGRRPPGPSPPRGPSAPSAP